MAKNVTALQSGIDGRQGARLQKDLVTALEFKDHFSTRSDRYAQYRPTYPDELFQFLASVAESNDVVWDCATGNGQAAVALANYFTDVVATDASQAQIDAAIRHSQVVYHAASAEESGLSDDSVDLVTVGQAFHWFDADKFFSEAQRVLRANGVLAVWCYELSMVNNECDALVYRLYDDILDEFWPPERVIIDQGYKDVILPGASVVAPSFQMSLDWQVADMLGFLRTWSATRRYAAQNGADPVTQIAAELEQAWGAGTRTVTWPLILKVSRPDSPARMSG